MRQLDVNAREFDGRNRQARDPRNSIRVGPDFSWVAHGSAPHRVLTPASLTKRPVDTEA